MGETDGFGEVVDLLVLYMVDLVCVAFAQVGHEFVELLRQEHFGRVGRLQTGEDDVEILVQAALEELKADGTLQSIVDKYITAE